MSYMYKILAVIGWSWTAVVALYLIFRLRNSRKPQPNGFDVLVQNEKQS